MAFSTQSKAVNRQTQSQTRDWPELPWQEWQDTAETLQLWMQIVGKIRLKLAVATNHWWHVTLYTTCRGLTTSPMPYEGRFLQIDFDFLDQQLVLQTSDGLRETVLLKPMTVSTFYTKVIARLNRLNIDVTVDKQPSEIADAIPFDEDMQHQAYDAAYATRFWRALLQSERVFTHFRSQFLGKVSPVHFFWGGMDLAVTRFSGRTAPTHGPVPGVPDSIVQAAYSHEVSSCGFSPGNAILPEPSFYAYAYPAPEGFANAKVNPEGAYFHPTLSEFILPYEAVRQAADPDRVLLSFLQSTYEAAANLGQWNRPALETAPT